MKRLSVCRSVATAVLIFVAVGAQAQTISGRLIGAVTDGGGVALPGVTVTISSPALIGGPQTRISDERGEFAFISLAPGEYTVNATLHGFITQERSEVKVNLGGAAAIAIVLPEGTFGGEVEVVAETPVVDPTQVNTEQVFSEDYLQNAAIGTLGRDYTSVLTQAAGVTGSSNPNVFGSTLGENAYYIDGIDTTDPVTATWARRSTSTPSPRSSSRPVDSRPSTAAPPEASSTWSPSPAAISSTGPWIFDTGTRGSRKTGTTSIPRSWIRPSRTWPPRWVGPF